MKPILPLIAILLLPATIIADELPWYRRHLVGMEVGPTGAQFGYSDPTDIRYAAKFNGKEIVDQAINAKSEYLVLWVRDGDYAYYNSKLLRKAPGLGQRDPLAEAMGEAKRRQIPIIAYCVVQQAGHFLKDHPEFEMRGIDGKTLGRFCLRSGYLDAMKMMLSEQLSYGINGFHVDMLDQGFGEPYGCWCETCQRQFQEQFGHPMPKEITWDENWDRVLQFRYQSSDLFEKAIADHVRRVNPRVTVDFNYHGNPPFSFEVGQRPVQHANNGDFVTGETGVWGFSALTVGLNAEFYRAATPGRPVQVAMQRGVRMYHDQTTRPLADLKWELFTLLSHGAFVTMVDKTGFDGGLDPVAYERIGSAFEEAKQKRRHFGHQPVQEVGIYFSHRTRDWWGRQLPAKYFQHFQGAHRAMAYHHIPYGVLLDENLTLEILRSYPVVLVPNAVILSPREILLFRQYVDQGGKLIFTGQPGCFDELGRPSNTSSVEELVGAKLGGTLESLDQWVKWDDRSPIPWSASTTVGLRTNWPFLLKGPAAIWKPVNANSSGYLMKAFRTVRQKEGKEGTEWPMSAESIVGPAILQNNIGQGTVLTFAGSPDYATASEHAIVEARALLADAVRFLHPSPGIRINAPANVEAVVTDDRDDHILRVHLLGYNSPPQTTPAVNRPFVLPAPMEEPPTFRVVIDTESPIRKVSSFGSSTQLKQSGNHIEATVSDVHEVLILKYEEER